MSNTFQNIQDTENKYPLTDENTGDIFSKNTIMVTPKAAVTFYIVIQPEIDYLFLF